MRYVIFMFLFAILNPLVKLRAQEIVVAGGEQKTSQVVVAVNLPELAGEYNFGGNQPDPAPSSRTTQFSIPEEIESFQQLRFVIDGTWTSGIWEITRDIGGVTVADTNGFYLSLYIRITSESLGDCFLFSWCLTTDGPFSCSELFYDDCPVGNADVNQLLGSTVTAELICGSPLDPGTRVIEDSFGSASSVRIEAEGAVPVMRNTWGSIKSQYR